MAILACKDLDDVMMSSDLILRCNDLHPAGLNDLYMFDPLSMEWSRIDGSVLGTAPVGRYNAGFTAAGDSICLFGGNSKSDRGVMSRMRVHFFEFLKGIQGL